MAKSAEGLVEDWTKKSLDDCGVKYSAKKAVTNSAIGAIFEEGQL